MLRRVITTAAVQSVAAKRVALCACASQPFVRLVERITTERYIRRDLSLYNNVNDFYEELLRFAPVSPKGILTLRAVDFKDLLRLVRAQDDVKVAVNALYNFIGHGVRFDQRDLDNFVTQALSLGAWSEVVNIFKYHTYVGYFPHPDVVDAFVAQVLQNGDKDTLAQLLAILYDKKMLKVHGSTFDNVVAKVAEDSDLLFKALWVAFRRRLRLSEATAKTLMPALEAQKPPRADLNEYLITRGALSRESAPTSTQLSLLQSALNLWLQERYEEALQKAKDLALAKGDDKAVAARILGAWDAPDGTLSQFFTAVPKSLSILRRRKVNKWFLQTVEDLEKHFGRDALHAKVQEAAENIAKLQKELEDIDAGREQAKERAIQYYTRRRTPKAAKGNTSADSGASSGPNSEQKKLDAADKDTASAQ